MYGRLTRLHTSTDRSAEELHATGLALVEQLDAEYTTVGTRLWGTSDVAEIRRRLRDDPELRYESGEEILAEASAAVLRAEREAPGWFVTVPETPCAVEPVPEALASGSPPAYYLPGAVDGSRKGTFFVNTSQPGARYRHLAEAVAFHEAVPGHHFQLTIAQGQTGLPLARRVIHDTAAAEGWGLYAERLADEMGLYTGDLTRLGMLSTDSWRAARLVIDTGLHALGWSRQTAVDWMRDHTPLALLEIDTEVDRYIAYPAQALSYMVGRLELEACRLSASDRASVGASICVPSTTLSSASVQFRCRPSPRPSVAGPDRLVLRLSRRRRPPCRAPTWRVRVRRPGASPRMQLPSRFRRSAPDRLSLHTEPRSSRPEPAANPTGPRCRNSRREDQASCRRGYRLGLCCSHSRSRNGRLRRCRRGGRRTRPNGSW